MVEFCQVALDFILANEWAMKLLYVVFCILAVGIVSLVKAVVSVATKRTNVAFDKKKFEFVFAFSAFAISFALIFPFVHIHKSGIVWNELVGSAMGALASQGIYALFCQPLRKTIAKLKDFFVKIFDKAKKGTIKPSDIDKALEELVATEEPQECSAVDEFNKYINE